MTTNQNGAVHARGVWWREVEFKVRRIRDQMHRRNTTRDNEDFDFGRRHKG
jgi:hypothetical protein